MTKRQIIVWLSITGSIASHAALGMAFSPLIKQTVRNVSGVICVNDKGSAAINMAQNSQNEPSSVRPQEDARRRINLMGLRWSEQDFEQTAKNNDQLALELYLQGGFPASQFSPIRNNFVAAIPFLDHTSGRFETLGLFRKYGLRFEEVGGNIVFWLDEYRQAALSPSFGSIRVRPETAADEILEHTLNLPTDQAQSDISTLRTYGLTCDAYLKTYNEYIAWQKTFHPFPPQHIATSAAYLSRAQHFCAAR